MQLFVKNVDGGTLALSVEPGHAVGRLKAVAIAKDAVSSASALYVAYGGLVLPDDISVSEAGLRNLSTVTLGVRCRGGGGDGGATGAESRDCYLSMYLDKKPDKFDLNELKLAKSTRCLISSEPLTPPCVMDCVGNLYNKEAVVQALLTKSLPKKLRPIIKGLKDVIDIKLSSIPGVSPDDENVETKFQCPITGLQFNGKFRFFALKGCGHVLSEKALKEVKTAGCLVCYAPYEEADKMVINGTEEEVATMREHWEEERAKVRGEKKVKKGANGAHAAAAVHAEVREENSFTQTLRPAVVPGSKRMAEDAILQTKEPVALRKGSDLIHPEKKFKAADKLLPVNATKAVYASIFTSSNKGSMRETYSCRSLPIGRN